MEQLCLAMGRYENIAALRVQQSLNRTNSDEKLRGGTGRKVSAVMMSDSIFYLEQASDLYAQV